VSNLLAQIKDSATLMCTSIDDPTVYPSCMATAKGDMTYLQWMIHGWGWTLVVALVALVIALAVGLVIGVMRTLPNKAAVLFGEAWTELFRNVPVLVQLFIWAFVLPEIFPSLKSVSYATLSCVGLGLFTSARVAAFRVATLERIAARSTTASVRSTPSSVSNAGGGTTCSLKSVSQ